MSDIATTVTAPAATVAAGAKRHPWLTIAVVGIGLLLIVRYRDFIIQKILGIAPAPVRRFARVGVAAVVAGFALFGASVAEAATCCARQLAASPTSSAWGVVAGFIATAVACLGATLFTRADTVDGQTTEGDRSIAYTPAATTVTEKTMLIKVAKDRSAGGGPLVAIDTTIALDTTVTQPSTGTASIEQDDLARLLAYMNIESPAIGTVLDKTTGAGPVLDLVLSFVAGGYSGGPDAPIDAITVPGSGSTDVAVTKYFTWHWAQWFLSDPLLTAIWLRVLHNTRVNVGIAPQGCLDDVSTGATVDTASTLRMATAYVPHSHWYRPQLGYWRLDTPASGSDALSFKNFGDKGPMASVPIDKLHTIAQLSNLKGLPGNTTIANITRILGSELGLDDVKNLDLFVAQSIRAQREPGAPPTDPASGGNWAMGTATSGMSLAGLLALYLRQPQVGMSIRNMPSASGQTEIKVREEFTSSRTGPDAFLFGSIRDFSDSVVQAWSGIAGVNMAGAPVPARR